MTKRVMIPAPDTAMRSATASQVPVGENRQRNATAWVCPNVRERTIFTLLIAAGLGFLFRSLMAGSLSRWMNEPQYSHGFVIPLIAIGLGWFRRDRVLPGIARSGWFGLVLLITGICLHEIAEYLYIEALDAVGFLLAVGGAVQLVWGTRLVLGIWPALAFLVFMLPLPFQFERMLSDPLQVLGAQEATYYIQTFGIPAVAQGNTILMGETQLGVAEACSGLRMLMVFLAISVATVVVVRRTRWEKILILFSAVPIALICNVARIVATAVAHQSFGRETADLIFHDLSGWLMMPLAMLLLFLELRLFGWLFVEVDDRMPGMRSGLIHQPSVLPGVIPARPF